MAFNRQPVCRYLIDILAGFIDIFTSMSYNNRHTGEYVEYMVPKIEYLLTQSAPEVFDYIWLMSQLKNYSAPRDAISRLLRQGILIRVKKGLYVLGDHYRQRPINLALVANLVYGPSYVSREYALSFYGLIPEGVAEITSMTNKRNKHFNTPVGRFDYHFLNEARYVVGIQWVLLENQVSALMAIPEKALADYVYVRKETIKTSSELAQVLLEDYRIDEEHLSNLDIANMTKIAEHYQNKTIHLLPEVIRKFKHE